MWDNLVIYWDAFWGIEINAELRLWPAAIRSQTGKINTFSNSWIKPPMPLHACADTRTLLSEPSASQTNGALVCWNATLANIFPLFPCETKRTRAGVWWREEFALGLAASHFRFLCLYPSHSSAASAAVGGEQQGGSGVGWTRYEIELLQNKPAEKMKVPLPERS